LQDEDDGRYQFSVWKTGKENNAVLIEMPGLPLEEVRYIKPSEQNIWNFPRLYVDDSSWIWLYALGATKGLIDLDKN